MVLKAIKKKKKTERELGSIVKHNSDCLTNTKSQSLADKHTHREKRESSFFFLFLQ